jgi:hypothetical protein
MPDNDAEFAALPGILAGLTRCSIHLMDVSWLGGAGHGREQ